VLNEMMKTFETWFPIDDSDTKEEIEMYKNGFARTKLCLELGEYSRDDYEYLFYIQNTVIENSYYYKAIQTFIFALSEEYGWI
jgi:hypothetical protein